MDNSQVFNLFRPICVKLTKEMSRDNVKTLREIVKRVDNQPIQDMQEYILFPLRLILKSAQSNEDLISEVVECISQILTKSFVRCWDLLQNLYSDVITLISHPKDSGQISNKSEELKLAVVHCISLLYEKLDKKLLTNVYNEGFFPQLGHLVFVLLRLAESEACKQLRIKSVQCLLILGLGNKKRGISLAKQASQMFTSFLPGISITLTKIITGSIIQGHGIVVAALNAWAEIVCLVLGDSYLLAAEDKVTTNAKLPIVVRDKTWIENSTSKLNVLIESIVELVCHDHWAVRLALANWAGMLLLQCNESLGKSMGPILDVLVTLSADERPNVAKQSCELLRKVTNQLKESSQLMDLVEENIHNLITKLPRIFHTASDSKKLATLRLLTGYTQLLVLLDNTIHRLLLSPPQMNRLGNGLIQLIELDLTNVRLLTEQNSSTKLNEVNSDFLQPVKKTFKHFQDMRIYSAWTTFCRMLGKFGDVTLLLDHCLDLFHSSRSHRNHAVMLIQELVIGSGEEKLGIKTDSELWQIVSEENGLLEEHVNETQVDLSGVVKSLLDVLLEPSLWRSNHASHGRADNLIDQSVSIGTPKIVELSGNVWLTCVIFEAIASFSQVLRLEFQSHLIRVMYPLLDKMGSESLIISHSAFYAANVISNNVGYDSIAKLIESNADYLVNSISSRLQHVDENPEAPRVLRSVFQNAGPEVLPLVDDSVEELFNSLDNFHASSSELFMDVLNSLINALYVWYPPSKSKSEKVTLDESESTSDVKKKEDEEPSVDSQTINDYFINYHRLKREAEGEIDDNLNDSERGDGEAVQEEVDEVDEGKLKKPKYVLLTVKALQRCVHFLPRKELKFSLLILDVIQSSVHVLKDWTDDLLPLIHQVWAPFKLKFSDGNLIVVRKAYETLLVMSQACGDFITKRTLTDVWPKLVSFLIDQSKISAGKDLVMYKFTAAYKLQLVILKTIGALTGNLRLLEDQFNDIVCACVPYLSKCQPPTLQQAAVETFNVLMTFEPDIVWLHLFGFGIDDCQLPSIDPCLSVIKVKQKENRWEYEENVNLLLEKVNSVQMCTL